MKPPADQYTMIRRYCYYCRHNVKTIYALIQVNNDVCGDTNSADSSSFDDTILCIASKSLRLYYHYIILEFAVISSGEILIEHTERSASRIASLVRPTCGTSKLTTIRHTYTYIRWYTLRYRAGKNVFIMSNPCTQKLRNPPHTNGRVKRTFRFGRKPGRASRRRLGSCASTEDEYSGFSIQRPLNTRTNLWCTVLYGRRRHIYIYILYYTDFGRTACL